MYININDIIRTESSISDKVYFTVLKYINFFIHRFKFHLHTGILKNMNVKLEKMYISIMGLTSVIEKECPDEYVQKVLVDTRIAVKNIREMYDMLENTSFFGNSSIKHSSEKVLESIYNLEFIAKKKAFRNNTPNGTSREAEIASQLQLEALQSL